MIALDRRLRGVSATASGGLDKEGVLKTEAAQQCLAPLLTRRMLSDQRVRGFVGSLSRSTAYMAGTITRSKEPALPRPLMLSIVMDWLTVGQEQVNA